MRRCRCIRWRRRWPTCSPTRPTDAQRLSDLRSRNARPTAPPRTALVTAYHRLGARDPRSRSLRQGNRQADEHAAWRTRIEALRQARAARLPDHPAACREWHIQNQGDHRVMKALLLATVLTAVTTAANAGQIT